MTRQLSLALTPAEQDRRDFPRVFGKVEKGIGNHLLQRWHVWCGLCQTADFSEHVAREDAVAELEADGWVQVETRLGHVTDFHWTAVCPKCAERIEE